jgi:hypothetical protein
LVSFPPYRVEGTQAKTPHLAERRDWKKGRNMHITLSGMIDYPVHNYYKPAYHPVYGGADSLKALS